MTNQTFFFRPLIDALGGPTRLVEPLGLGTLAHARGMYVRDRVPGHFGLAFVSLVRCAVDPEFSEQRYLELLNARFRSEEAAHG